MRTKERSEFGERLYQARQHARLSQEALADRVGMTQNNLSHLELHGLGTPKVDSLAQACGVRVAWLARNEGPMLSGNEPDDVARHVAEELVGYGPAPNDSTDFRTVAFTLADSLDEAGVQLSNKQFLELADNVYKRLRTGGKS